MPEKFIPSKIETDPAQEALESLGERLHLREQYLAQVKVLYQSGVLENFAAQSEHPLPEMGIVGIDGQEYYLPTYEDILDKLQDPEKRAVIAKKAEQGFTNLLLVPFALPFSVLTERYKQTLLKINQETGIQATDGSVLELNTQDPLYVWENLVQCDNPASPKDKQLEYQVQNYEGQTKEQRGGKYKSELLQETPPNAWHILLIEDNPDLPSENQGKTSQGRKQIEANQTPKDYLKLLQTKSEYQNEQGLTPEANLTLWLTYLQERQTALDDWQGQGQANWLVGNYLSGSVPDFSWYRDYLRPRLYGSDSDDRDADYGFRPAVRF